MFTLQIQFYYIIISNNQQTRSRLFQTPKNIPPAALNPSSLFKPDTLLALQIRNLQLLQVEKNF